MTDPSQPLFLFGPGYSATVLAKLWHGPVRGTLRSAQGAAKLKSAQIEPIALQDRDAVERAIAGSHVVISAPPGENGCPARPILQPFITSARSVTYLSTTGVYGDLKGGWAMEWSPIQPGSERGQRRAVAERDWQAIYPNVCIVRLPGIYGPGRSALDRVHVGTARRIVKPGQVFSRIHVDDLATGLKALILSDARGAYNLCDERAAPPQDVTQFACELLDKSVPPDIAFESAELSAMARSFYSECKRVSNAKLKATTGWRPTYPTYVEGLRAIVEHRGGDV